MNYKILFLLPILTLFGCPHHEYNTGHFPEIVINFAEVNTVFDDYNSNLPIISHQYSFYFSSNRNSMGSNFDIVGKNMYITWDIIDGTLDVGTNVFGSRFDYVSQIFDTINTSCNELGPYFMGYTDYQSYSESEWIDLFLFASDCDSDFDIKYVYSVTTNNNGVEETFISSLHKLSIIENGANELYPTFFGNDFYYFDEYGTDVSNLEKLLYCSDKTGNYNIYQVDLPAVTNLLNVLDSQEMLEEYLPDINSPNDDKCPYVNGNLLVFCSDRPGGFGGFDIYYSVYEDGDWSNPENFGDRINTAYDEYRPIIIHYNDFNNNLMIFSSNRPGGKGGYDLYYTGIDQSLELILTFYENQ